MSVLIINFTGIYISDVFMYLFALNFSFPVTVNVIIKYQLNSVTWSALGTFLPRNAQYFCIVTVLIFIGNFS